MKLEHVNNTNSHGTRFREQFLKREVKASACAHVVLEHLALKCPRIRLINHRRTATKLILMCKIVHGLVTILANISRKVVLQRWSDSHNIM